MTDDPAADGDLDADADTDFDADDSRATTVSESAIEALCDALALKDETRTGWALRGVHDPESVAAHSWGVAYLVVAIGETFTDEFPDLDLDAALRMAVVHDLGEAETGDVPTRADPEAAESLPDADEQAAAERDAVTDLTASLDAAERLRSDWETYERRDRPEARVVKDLDVVDMCLQALVYERADRYDQADSSAADPTTDDPAAGAPTADAFAEYDALDEFFVTARRSVSTETGRALLDRIHDRYVTARDHDDPA
ncbi:HD domain-containing protein [Halopenitus sp. POP-27]|uniref:HD domain-containing protein n=1 Tax=Halopenitus sp. POP-27 TaxID=2994425 RepID=UPI002468DCC5|nr:HD domain-containing protein [Halopenitus sp. POP-27]